MPRKVTHSRPGRPPSPEGPSRSARVSLPQHYWDEIAERAARSDRTISGELRRLLRRAFATEPMDDPDTAA